MNGDAVSTFGFMPSWIICISTSARLLVIFLRRIDEGNGWLMKVMDSDIQYMVCIFLHWSVELASVFIWNYFELWVYHKYGHHFVKQMSVRVMCFLHSNSNTGITKQFHFMYVPMHTNIAIEFVLYTYSMCVCVNECICTLTCTLCFPVESWLLLLQSGLILAQAEDTQFIPCHLAPVSMGNCQNKNTWLNNRCKVQSMWFQYCTSLTFSAFCLTSQVIKLRFCRQCSK